MITKERLEELIEQGGSVWHNDWEEIKLDKNTCEVCEVRSMSGMHLNWFLCFEYNYNDRKYWEEIDIEELEEDVDKFKWDREFGCIERTERLVLPTWEEIQKYERFDFKDKYNHSYTLHYISGFKTLAISGWSTEYYAPATKENYTLACRKAKELFLGEKK